MNGREGIEYALTLAGTIALAGCRTPSPTNAYSCTSRICTGTGCTDYVIADVCAASASGATSLCATECPAAADDCTADLEPTLPCYATGVLVHRNSDMRFSVDETVSFANHTDSKGNRLFEVSISGDIYVSGSWCDGCSVTIDGISLAQSEVAAPGLPMQPTDVTMTSTSHPSHSVSTAGASGTFAGTVMPGGTLWMAYRGAEGGSIVERHLYNPGPVNFAFTNAGLLTSIALGTSIDATYNAVLTLAVTNHRPVAASMMTYDAAAIPPAVVLDGTSTTDADVGDMLTYLWNDESGARVGDGPVVSLPAVPGTHAFTLTVIDAAGTWSTDAHAVLVP